MAWCKCSIIELAWLYVTALGLNVIPYSVSI